MLARCREPHTLHSIVPVLASMIRMAFADRLKQIEKYHALYFTEGRKAPVHIRLLEHA
jgi:hypothetical protein